MHRFCLSSTGARIMINQKNGSEWEDFGRKTGAVGGERLGVPGLRSDAGQLQDLIFEAAATSRKVSPNHSAYGTWVNIQLLRQRLCVDAIFITVCLQGRSSLRDLVRRWRILGGRFAWDPR